MKTPHIILAACFALAAATSSLIAAPHHGHDHHHHIATPKGGRHLEKTEPLAELVIENDRSVTIHFYNADLKPVPATTQTATLHADAKSGKAKIEFEKKGDVLVSKAKLPEGDGYNIAIQFRQTPEAKPINTRFKLDLSTCGECKRSEYACTCHH